MVSAHRYVVRRISTLSLAKFGCVLGGIAMVLPGIICGLVATQVIAILRIFLEEQQASELDLLGVPVQLDFITVFGLDTVQTLLINLDDQRFTLILLIILVSIIGGGLLVALTILLLGWSYNILAALTGGLQVELRE